MTERALESELSGIGALVLDVDDTIVDTRAAMTEAGTHAAAALWPDHGHAHRDMALRYYDDPQRWFHRFAAGEVPVEAMRLARLRDVAEAFAVELPADAHDRYLAAYVPAFRRVQRLFDDVPDLLAAADDAGVRVALLTNSTTVDTSLKLEALGLADRFANTVVTTDTLGVGKPDPRVYLEACRLVETDPGSAVCIGDSLEWDVLGAIRAGLRAVWLDRGSVGTAVDVLRVSSLREVTATLAAVHPRFGTTARDR